MTQNPFDPRQLSLDVMQAAEVMTAFFDAADGMRMDLERRGWSPTAAEQIAQSWLMAMLGVARGGGA
ncbi:hypothetical protein [Streptomyces asiaticus]|uniref:hypothetical protein n=1 Tax=Streptomyces asiaticus TaxID=114695 RepID=UPI001BAA98FE|nr:hypothetical protein [Streptomyces asiaticus]